MTPGNKKRKIEHWHVIAACLTIYDVIAVNAAYLIALWLRFDCAYSQIPKEYLDAYFRFAPVYTVFSMLVFRALRLYKSMWRFASYDELLRVFVASVATFAFHTVALRLFCVECRFRIIWSEQCYRSFWWWRCAFPIALSF